MSYVYVLVNISNNKITFIEFACFGDKCFVVPPRVTLATGLFLIIGDKLARL